MIFKIYSISWHNPENWGSEDEILAAYPSSRISAKADDGWVEIEWYDLFEAQDTEEAKEKALHEYDTEVFTVYGARGQVLFTEEDL